MKKRETKKKAKKRISKSQRRKLQRLEIISIIFVSLVFFFFVYTALSDSKNNETEPHRHYCTPEQRNVDVCIEIYEPVCGYPVEQTFSNSCFACMDETVEYWTHGTCE